MIPTTSDPAQDGVLNLAAGVHLGQVCIVTERSCANARNELVLRLNIRDGHYLELQQSNLPRPFACTGDT